MISVPRRPLASPTTASGASGSPSRKRMTYSLPSRQMRRSSTSESAFTTETPTPCRPPDDLVGVLVELPAGMELGHDDLGRRDALLLVDVDGNAAAVVGDRDRAVAVQRHLDAVAVAGERLVDRVVDHLVDHVVQARAVVGVADIHARALAHGIEAAQHLDGVGVVVAGGRARGLGIAVCGHGLSRSFRIRSAGRRGIQSVIAAGGRARAALPRPRNTGPWRRAARRDRHRCR